MCSTKIFLAMIFNEIKCHVNTSLGVVGGMHPLHPPVSAPAPVPRFSAAKQWTVTTRWNDEEAWHIEQVAQLKWSATWFILWTRALYRKGKRALIVKTAQPQFTFTRCLLAAGWYTRLQGVNVPAAMATSTVAPRSSGCSGNDER